MLRLFLTAFLGAALAGLATAGRSPAYPWPIKPFHTAHPVRGNFGDPRTRFALDSITPESLEGEGQFSFHNGVDISAPAGKRVYPIASGVTTIVTATTVAVRSPKGRVFQYVHVDPVVVRGQRVEAQRTVLGFVKSSAMHVHLTELNNGRLANPLAPGHLAPYSDSTLPVVSEVAFRTLDGGPAADPVNGIVDAVATAYDLPALPVPGNWRGLPVTPALVEWSVTSFAGRTVRRLAVAADFRRTIPLNRLFWDVYARGTYQNKPRFGNVQYGYEPGRYEFHLGWPGLDTTRLADGLYALHVRASDTRGNVGAYTQPFAVCNDATNC